MNSKELEKITAQVYAEAKTSRGESSVCFFFSSTKQIDEFLDSFRVDHPARTPERLPRKQRVSFQQVKASE
jgi:hypothetical protein